MVYALCYMQLFQSLLLETILIKFKITLAWHSSSDSSSSSVMGQQVHIPKLFTVLKWTFLVV
jgi:hypothetical protein